MFQKIKKFLYVFYFLFLLPYPLTADEPLKNSVILAQELMTMRDYKKADEIYLNLLNTPLPDWQQAVVLYNLATLKLIEGENQIALDKFHSIAFDTIANPYLFGRITFNQASAYFNLAQRIDLSFSFNFLEKIEAYQQSIKNLKNTQTFDCLIQKIEGVESCSTEKNVATNYINICLEIEKNKQQLVTHFLDKNEGVFVFFLLKKKLEKIQIFFNKISWSNLSTSLQKSYQNYLLKKAEKLFILWEKLASKTLTINQKRLTNDASAFFYEFLINIQKNEMLLAQENLQKVVEKMNEISFDFDADQLENLLFHYHLILLENELEISSLKTLKKFQKDLKINEQNEVKKSYENLSKSVKFLAQENPQLSYFFLLIAFYELQFFSIEKIEVPQTFLEKLTLQIWVVKKLTQQFLILKEEIPEAKKILEGFQKNIILLAEKFFKKTLIFQQKMFQKKTNDKDRCQDKPWDQVFPLFVQGRQSAIRALNLIDDPSQAISEQELTFNYWKEALKILKQNADNFSSAELPNNAISNEKFNELFHSIQEMQAQDEINKKESKQDLHSW